MTAPTTNTDIDNLPLAGVVEVSESNHMSISLTIQRTNGRVTRHFEGDYHALHMHAYRNPKVVLLEVGCS
jgi:hypothetical protein